MSIVSSELRLYCAASMPENDTATTGGAIDLEVRPVFTQLTADAVGAAVSDGADTRDVAFTGRLDTGAISSETETLNGAVEVTTTAEFERLLKVLATTTSGTRTVTIKQGAGGSTVATIPPNEKGFRLMFYNSASESGEVVRNEKCFYYNANPTLTLTDAEIELSADPSTFIKIGLAASKDDTATIANRLATPGGISFVDDGVAQAIPDNTLEAETGIGIWIKQTLPAAQAPAKSTFTLQITGKSI